MNSKKNFKKKQGNYRKANDEIYIKERRKAEKSLLFFEKNLQKEVT